MTASAVQTSPGKKKLSPRKRAQRVRIVQYAALVVLLVVAVLTVDGRQVQQVFLRPDLIARTMGPALLYAFVNTIIYTAGAFIFGLALGSTLVLQRRFDPEAMLDAVEQHRCEILVVVPVMLQRAMELPQESFDQRDVSSLRIIAASGSALPGPLATDVMDRLGDVLYNLYGSTEVAWATIATPEDLRAAPGTAGRAPMGTVVKLFDDEGNEVPHGETGRIFVGNELQFEGYTGGGNKDFIDGLMSSGDVGHFDDGGRLFIDGRDDEMAWGHSLEPRLSDLVANAIAQRDAARLRRGFGCRPARPVDTEQAHAEEQPDSQWLHDTS